MKNKTAALLAAFMVFALCVTGCGSGTPFQPESLPGNAARDSNETQEAGQEWSTAALNAEEEGVSVEPAFIELEDGEYAIAVELSGGSGKSTVASPAGLIVKDGLAYARIQWSSSNYDYMIVGGEKYLPVNEEGYSTFEIPILVFNEKMPVIADTTAMSTPHEVKYTLTFHADEIMSKDQTPQAAAKKVVYMVAIVVAVCALVSFISKKRRNAVR